DKTFAIDAPPAPFRAVVSATPLFVPARLDPRSTDQRYLAGQVQFQFVPKRPTPAPGKPADIGGVAPDGWMGQDAGYAQGNAPFNLPARIRVTVSRANWPGKDV